jgi:hypothetical protein
MSKKANNSIPTPPIHEGSKVQPASPNEIPKTKPHNDQKDNQAN